MPTYEQKLDGFSQGKRLLRLPRLLRDRADAYCDTCGSSQPRTLYTIKDLESERYFFVGDTYLKELTKRGAVLRRYGRESGQKAFESEVLLRAEELERGKASSNEHDAVAPATEGWRPAPSRKWRSRSDAKCVRHLAKRPAAPANSP